MRGSMVGLSKYEHPRSTCKHQRGQSHRRFLFVRILGMGGIYNSSSSPLLLW